jgi:hypothetical protein
MLLILPNSPRTAESKEADFLKMLEFPGKPAKVLKKVPFVL